MSTPVWKRTVSRRARSAAGLMALLGLVGAIIGAIIGIARPTTYSATSALYISSARPESGVDSSQLTTTVSDRMYSYYNLVDSNTVLQPVITKLKLNTTVDQLSPSVKASVPTDSMVIDVTVNADSTDKAVALSNAVRDSLSNAIVAVTPDQSGGSPAIEVHRYQDASASTTRNSPNLLLYVIPGALLGVAAGKALQVLARRRRADGRNESTEAPKRVVPQ